MKSGMKHIGIIGALAALGFGSAFPITSRKSMALSSELSGKVKYAGNGVPKNQRQRRKLDRQVPQRRRA